MKPGIIYRSEWLMQDDTTTVKVDIFDTSVLIDDSDDPNIIELIPSGSPLKISVIDNDRDKLTPIKSKQAVIEVLTENGIDITTFTGGPDNQFYVEITTGEPQFIFKGFLVTADLNQAFLANPQVLTLTATDGLGFLRDAPLTDLDGNNPEGKHKLSHLLAYCLNKTGLALSIYVVNNLRHGSGVFTGPLFFSGAGQYFVTEGLLTTYFYVGQEITISGTASNDGTFIVTEVDNSSVITQVRINATITGESATPTITDTSSDVHLYNSVFLDAKTFETEIGECENCRTVLEKILGEDCYLTQYRGNWWIVRVDEFDEHDIYVAIFESSGTFGTFEGAMTYNKSVGQGEDLYMVRAAEIVERERPLNTAKLTFNYNTPLEILCNINYTRGPASGSGTLSGYSLYDIDCWTTSRDFGANETTPNTTAHIARKFNDLGYEDERFIVILQPASFTNPPTYIRSSRVPMKKKDMFSFSVDYGATNDNNSSDNFILGIGLIVLYGNDGSVWTLDCRTGEEEAWNETDAEISLFRREIQWDFSPDTEDLTEWKTFSITSYPLPVDGEVVVYLYAANRVSSSADNINMKYSNISFEYIQYINGSYRKYTGQYQKVTRPETGYLATRDKEVFISDSPKPLLKGSMFLLIDGKYVLTTKFYPLNVYPSTPPDNEVKPYGELQIRSVFNQWVYPNWVFSGTVKGVDNDWPDMIHKYILTDTHPSKDNRYFLLSSFEQDWKTGEMNATFIEVYDRVKMKRYSDDREFKYLERNG